MKKNLLLSLPLLAAAWMTSSSAWAHDGDHSYNAQGICTLDECSDPYQPAVKDVDGYYMLGNAGQVEWFSKQENAKPVDFTNAKLTADIDMEGVKHMPIGSNSSNKYRGIFDGQGHRILNMTEFTSVDNVGFFGATRGQSATIKNLIIDKSCLIKGGNRVGAFVGDIQYPNSPNYTTLENCINEANVEATGDYVGGLIGGTSTNDGCAYIKNCINLGNVSGNSNVGAFVGKTVAGAFIISSYNEGKVLSGMNGFNNLVAEGNTTFKGACDLANVGVQGTIITDENAKASGELCYKLNGDQTDIQWTQTIRTDDEPVLGKTQSQVYESAAYNCGGQPVGGVQYTNVSTGEPVLPPHTMDDNIGMCSVCHTQFQEPALVDGFYEICNVGNLAWFRDYVNKGNLSAKAKLMNDIDMDGFAWEPIARYDGATKQAFGGQFDGCGHVIRNLTMTINDSRETGLFGRCQSATVSNLGIINATISNSQGIRAGVLGGELYKSNINNCYTAGTISITTGNSQKGGLAGEGAQSNFNNCYTSYNVVANNVGKLTNCYSGNAVSEALATGELCYKLNGDQSIIVYYQTIGEDAYPTLDSTRGQVYVAGTFNCAGESLGGLQYTNVETSAPILPDHTIDGTIGMCSVCHTQFQEPALVDGFYEICNAGNLEWFSGHVNKGNMQVNAKLMNDIDMLGIENLHTPIGNSTGAKFNGIFDGQGHRIKNLIINLPTTNNIGFFGWLRGNDKNTEVRNLIIDKSCSFIGNGEVAAIAGSFQNTGATIILENIINEANVTANGSNAGGLLGGLNGDPCKWQVRNFLNTGTITSGVTNNNPWGGAVGGWVGNNGNSSFENILNIGTVVGHQGGNLGRLPGTVTNVIDLSETDNKTQGVIEDLTIEDLANGKVANMLGWGQLINTDACPSPLSDVEVYAVGEAGYATMVAAEGTKLNGDAQAYIGKKNGEYLTLTEVADVPAGQAVVLKGTYYNKVACTATADCTGNDLVAATSDVECNGTQYVLANVNDVVGFYKANSGTIKAGKGYLVSTASVKAFFFGDTATGIELTPFGDGQNGDNGQQTTEIFNLAGQRVSKMQKGVNIVNGKKVMF